MRLEFQDLVGNVPHGHLMGGVRKDDLTPEELQSLEDIIRASINDVVCVDEVPELNANGILKSQDKMQDVIDDADKFLSHRCNQ